MFDYQQITEHVTIPIVLFHTYDMSEKSNQDSIAESSKLFYENDLKIRVPDDLKAFYIHTHLLFVFLILDVRLLCVYKIVNLLLLIVCFIHCGFSRFWLSFLCFVSSVVFLFCISLLIVFICSI